MTQLIAIIQCALPVFLALALGMLCRQKKFLDRSGIDTLKKVVLNITLPAVLLNAFATAEYSASAMLMPGIMYLLCCLALLLGFVFIRLSGSKSKLAPYLASGFEAGMLGYALFVLLFPERSISEFALLDLGQTLFVFTLYKFLLSGKNSLKAILRDIVTSPILWAVLAGVLLGATGLYRQLQSWGISGILDAATSFISAPTGMVILMTVGYDLVLRDISWKRTAGFIAMRLGIMTVLLAILILLNRTVLQGMIFEGAALLMLILPPPYVIPVFADEPSERVQISSSLSALTLISMLLFAVLSVLNGVQG